MTHRRSWVGACPAAKAVVENGVLPINRRVLAAMSSTDLNRTLVKLYNGSAARSGETGNSRVESIERSARRHTGSNKVDPDGRIAIDRSLSPGALREGGRRLPARRTAGHRRSDDRVTTIKDHRHAAIGETRESCSCLTSP